MSTPLAAIFAHGFFTSEAVRVASVIGALVALVTGVVGVFAVIRRQSFATEALGHVGATGGSAAFLVGVGPLAGFAVANVLAAGALELIGVQSPRSRDVATGIVLGAGLGLAALILYFDATFHNLTGAAITVLFGSIFLIAPSTVPVAAALAAAVLIAVATLYRPLLLSSLHPQLAAARGIHVRLLGAVHLVALALAVALASITIGTILATSLIVGPAASALRITRRPASAIATAVLVGLGATWLGILLSYDSYEWPPLHRGWPVSFFVVTLVLLAYLLSGLLARASRARSRARNLRATRQALAVQSAR
ncbi:MAG: metal ABC transporter permease [Solirubrobacteraceae bacterium]